MSVSLVDGHIDDVMTDEQIIKALKCCSNAEPCANCPYQKQCDETDLAEIALDLINRQKAEIERLKRNIEALAICKKDLPQKTTNAIIAEAVKQFAERLKENKIDIDVSFGYGREVYTEAVAVIEIDNLVKEMVGES